MARQPTAAYENLALLAFIVRSALALGVHVMSALVVGGYHGLFMGVVCFMLPLIGTIWASSIGISQLGWQLFFLATPLGLGILAMLGTAAAFHALFLLVRRGRAADFVDEGLAEAEARVDQALIDGGSSDDEAELMDDATWISPDDVTIERGE